MRTGFDRRTRKDVVVAGGGLAGVGAALAAARNGASVLLVERTQCVGGLATGGLVARLHTLRHHVDIRGKNAYQETGYQAEQVVRGITQEMADRLIDIGGAIGRKGESSSVVLFDPELMMVTLEEMLAEAGVEIWYNSQVTDADLQGNLLKSMAVDNKSGHCLVDAGVFIDATGDGDLAYFAGAEFELGRPQDGRTMPMSLVFILGNVDLRKMIDHLKEHREEYTKGDIDKWDELYRAGKPISLRGWRGSMAKAYEAGDFTLALGAQNPYPLLLMSSIVRWGKVAADELMCISDMAYGVNAVDNDQLTRAILSTRARAYMLTRFLRKYVPGFENANLLQTASQIGIRETRRIMGEYVITQDDIAEGRFFEDAIGRGGRALNVHSEVGGKEDGYPGGGLWIEPKKPYYVPYRALVPRTIDGLLVAGRCVSVDHIALGSLRGEPLCIVTGEAAGTAAALAVGAGVQPRNIDIGQLQKTLTKQNVDIGEISKRFV